MKNSLGPTIKALRKMRKMTQAELALRVGLERTSITNIEKGNQPISTATLEAVAETLGYQVQYQFKLLK
jgi:transcriptional regulator with XRE-family HTH domain